MRIEINHCFTGNVMFSGDVDASLSNKNLRLGAAVKLAINAGADLARAYLADADLAGAYLARAYLTGANLAGANLAGANLAGAYLEGTNLAGANLAGADLAGAYLTGTNLAGANLVIDAGYPNGWRCVGWLKDGVIQVRVGCRDKALAEGRAYWAGREDRREVLAALDYIETVAELRGWAT